MLVRCRPFNKREENLGNLEPSVKIKGDSGFIQLFKPDVSSTPCPISAAEIAPGPAHIAAAPGGSGARAGMISPAVQAAGRHSRCRAFTAAHEFGSFGVGERRDAATQLP